MTPETASLLALLRVANAPLLASLPIELLYSIFVAGGLDKATGWRFEEQRKTDRSLIVDAVCTIANFVDNTHEEDASYRLEGCSRCIETNPSDELLSLIAPVLEVWRTPCSLFHFYPRCGVFLPKRTLDVIPRWHWQCGLDNDALFQSLLTTKKMRAWLKHCEEHFCK